jgi:predicted deacylase
MKTMKRLLGVLAIIIFTNPWLYSQLSPTKPTVDEIFGEEGEKYFMFQLQDWSFLPALRSIISIDNVKGADIYAYANRQEFKKFLDYQIDYTILPHPGDFEGELNMKGRVNIREITEWDFYPTYEAYLEMMNQFAADYPDLCTVFSIGQSVFGRELLVAKISDNVNVTENEPRFLYTSSMHGDELTGYVLMLRLIDYLLSNYGSDDRITALVDGIEIWINPLANPDGTYAGGNYTVNGARRYNANWVDLNRNYPDPEAGPHPDGEEWQAETVAFMEMAEGQHFVSAANFHGGAEVCNYPWDTWQRLHADNDWWVDVCKEWADTAQHYSPPGYLTFLNNGITNGYAWYWITGGRQDYMNYFHQCREFTMEISNTKLPPPAQLPDFWEYNYRSIINYLEHCTFGIRGIVTDTTTSLPVYAEVRIEGHEMDSSWVYSELPYGNYHRLVDEGTYSVSFTADGYFPKTIANVTVGRKVATILDVELLSTGVGGIQNNPISQAIKTYPNPVNEGKVRIVSEIPINTCTIFASTGDEVIKIRIYDRQALISLSNLDPGTYLFLFDTPEGQAAKKVMIY